MNIKELLVRKPVEVAAGLGELESRTLEKARATLGYRPEISADALAHSTATANGVFMRLGIEQFTPLSVNKYKAAMLAKMNVKAKFADFFQNTPGIHILVISCAGTFVLGLVSLLSYLTPMGAAHPFLYADWQWLFVPAMLTAICGISCCCMDDTEYEWERTPLNQYKAEVPYFAISRAIEINEQLPEATFYVESLQARRRETADPFLVVSIEGYLYYVDVWDEPKFEGRRVK